MQTKNNELFDGLMKLCAENEAFYFSDQIINGNIIRSFTYRLASCTDFQSPYAKDSRGTAFIKINDEWRLFTRAYKKFFNLGECAPRSVFMENNTVIVSYEKLDGSLILVGEVDGMLVTKSKTSINSEQAILAQEILNSHEGLQLICRAEMSRNRTPVFELVGPDNVIVLRYVTNEMIFLGAVDNDTGEPYSVETMEDYEYIMKTFGVRCAMPYNYNWDELLTIQETAKPSIEGFVVKSENGLVKVKCLSYVHLHHMKDSINNKKSLISLIVSDNTDDIIGVFRDDQKIIDYITNVQEKVSCVFNHLVIEFKELRRKYYQDFNENRKEFALKHKEHKLFSYVMKTLNSSFRDVEEIAETSVKDYILKACYTQSKAEEWYNSIC